MGLVAARRRHGPGAGFVAFVCALACLLWPLRARADEEFGVFAPEIHAFVSQGFIKTTSYNYLANSQKGSFEFTEAAINFTARLNDELRLGVQLYAQDLGPVGDYKPQLDWYYLDYRPRDWFGIRAGRTKIPFGLYNDSSDADTARVPVLLPQSVYPIDHRDYLLAQTGGEVYGNLRLGGAGAFEYRAYGGTIHMSAPPPRNGVSVRDFSVPYVWGGRVMWSPLEGLQAGASFQSLRLDWDYHVDPLVVPVFQALGLLPAEFDGVLPVEFRVKLWVASLEYQVGELSLAAEYARWTGEFESRAPALLPPHIVNERYYLMASYRVTPWFTPGAYYSVYYPNLHERRGPAAYQRDAAVSFRYDLTENWLLKLEGHWIHGTASLDPELNAGRSPNDQPADWGAFLVKTTAYF